MALPQMRHRILLSGGGWECRDVFVFGGFSFHLVVTQVTPLLFPVFGDIYRIFCAVLFLTSVHRQAAAALLPAVVREGQVRAFITMLRLVSK